MWKLGLVLTVAAAACDFPYPNIHDDGGGTGDGARKPDASAIDATRIDAMPADAAIDGPPNTYHVGGAVTGMWSGVGVTLDLLVDGTQTTQVTVNSNTGFTFDASVPDGHQFAVQVGTQPASHTCTPQNASGTIAGADVNDVSIDCAGPTVAIALSAPIAWTFDASTTTYALDTSVIEQETAVTVTSPSATAITLNATTGLVSGVASPVVPLALGANSLSVRVDAGAANRTFTIGLNRGNAQVTQYLYGKASNANMSDVFGTTAAMSGDTLVIGAPGEARSTGAQNDNNAAGAGAAYVFRRSGTTWTQEAYLKSTGIDAGDKFGSSVAISGDTIVVGAPFEDSSSTGIGGNPANNGATDSGAAYVFHRVGTTWSSQAYIKASNAEQGDQFGTSVGIDQDTLVVGAVGEDSAATGINGTQSDNTDSGAGATYVFVRNGTTWSQQAYLKRPVNNNSAAFGQHVTASGNTVAVSTNSEASCATGINGDATNSGCISAGAAYVFIRNGSTWTQQAYVKASNSAIADQFGDSISLDGDELAIGANLEDSGSTSQSDNSQSAAGAVYVFRRNGTTWTEEAYLKETSPISNHYFGADLVIAGDELAVGVNAGSGGTVDVFHHSSSGWSLNQGIGASNGESGDDFGMIPTATLTVSYPPMIALTREDLAVGALFEDGPSSGINPSNTGNGATDSGAVYGFH